MDKDASSSSEEKHPPTEHVKAKKASRLPEWIASNLKSVRSLKVLARCWLASWAGLILLLPQPSLEVLGQAAFFTMLLTFILPANMPASIFVFANLTLVVGCCIGWAWSCAAMAASLRARNTTLTQEQIRQTYQALAGSNNIEGEFQVAIFRGDFLETNSSVVFGVFIVVAAYLSGIMQAKFPKLKIGGVFLLIVADVMCSYGPLFPAQNYLLAKIFMIPIGCSIAISLACQFLVFPETLNTAWQYNLIKLLGVARKTLGIHRSTMERMRHEDPSTVEAEVDPQIRAMHAGMVALAGAMDGQRGFLELEITYSRLGGKDLSMLYLKMRTMLIRLLGLNAFFHLLELDLRTGEVKNDGPVSLHETHTILHYRQHMYKTEAEQHVELDNLLGILIEATEKPLRAIDACLEATIQWLGETVERKSSYHHETWLNKLQDCQDELQQSMETFLETDRLRLIEPYRNIFKHEKSHLTPESQQLFRTTARPLFICLVFCANLVNLGEELLTSHDAIVDLAKKRPKNKIWLPTGLRKIGKLIRSKKPVVGKPEEDNVLINLHKYESQEDEEHTDEEDEKRDSDATIVDSSILAGQAEPRDPDSLGPTNFIHKGIRGIASAHRFFYSPASLYGLRFAIVTFALWIPSVIPSSAYFVYLHRGIWALIMGQTGMALSSGELVFSLGGRLIGTLMGCVLGMLYWYMSCGLAARGNPYGLAAVCAIGFIPIIFLRIFAPPVLLLPALMCGVTTALCIGYSWIDSHLVVLSNSGIGVAVAWRRTLLVIIGMTAAFIVTIFPTPPSTREHVRQGFARSTDNISRLYSILIESWIVVEARDADKEAPRQEKLKTILRSRFVAAQGTLTGLRMDINLAPLDIAYKGPWPKNKYEELLKVHSRLLGAISQMAGALQSLDLEWRRKLLHTSAILSPKTISEISTVLTLLANALRTGTPLPHASTSLFESTVLNQQSLRQVERTIEEKSGSREDLLTLDVIKNEQFMKHTAGVMALMTFVRQMDKFHHLVRELVGEVDLPGYHHLKQHYDQRFIDAHLPSDKQA